MVAVGDAMVEQLAQMEWNDFELSKLLSATSQCLWGRHVRQEGEWNRFFSQDHLTMLDQEYWHPSRVKWKGSKTYAWDWEIQTEGLANNDGN